MKIASFTQDLQYNEKKPLVNIILETDNSKEIRIVFKRGQIMKEHKTPFPILVQVFRGEIDFGVNGKKHRLSEGSIIALGGGIPHDLVALNNSIVRLSLSKNDSIERVKNIKTS
ncbi:MAG: cupin [Pseudooceanicola sp.]|nr:cupin [Pseudooceanicola sp.]|tara:strand:- start:694 stop:1035 length:342 start_codon:yes stop_codon:yes gene_type:complete